MQRYLITIVLLMLTIAGSAKASPLLTLGAGVESRISRDVNPDYDTNMGFGALYLSLAMHPWTLLWELERAQTNDHNGNYSIQNTYYTTMVWGRWEPWETKVSPYLGLGLGWQLHDITSRFGPATDTRWGDGGGIVGLSAGAMTTLFDHWNIEGEMRLAKFELTDSPTWSFMFRSGYTF